MFAVSTGAIIVHYVPGRRERAFISAPGDARDRAIEFYRLEGGPLGTPEGGKTIARSRALEGALINARSRCVRVHTMVYVSRVCDVAADVGRNCFEGDRHCRKSHKYEQLK